MNASAAERQKPARCSNCLYWRLQRPKEGNCCRHAPAAGEYEFVAHWPETHGEQLCGSHAETAAGKFAACADCRFWFRPPDGFQPADRDDKLMSWWARAGYCRHGAPEPSSAPGPRAFWAATHATDGCGEGRATPARPSEAATKG